MTPPTPARLRWVMIGFAFAATVLNYVHRLSFAYLAAHPDLIDAVEELFEEGPPRG